MFVLTALSLFSSIRLVRYQPIHRPRVFISICLMPFAGSASSTPYTLHNDRRPLPQGDDFDNDKHSTMSHASGVSRVEHGYDALRQVAGNRVRRGYCAPEFLEEIASRGVQTSLKKHPERRFTVLSGMEARSYFKDYLRCVPLQ